jgi:hypothetical protein
MAASEAPQISFTVWHAFHTEDVVVAQTSGTGSLMPTREHKTDFAGMHNMCMLCRSQSYSTVEPLWIGNNDETESTPEPFHP